jgi:hypothetical protein
MFTTDKPEWAKKPTQSWHKDVWDIYFMGWGVPEGKLLTYEAYAAKQAKNPHLGGFAARKQIPISKTPTSAATPLKSKFLSLSHETHPRPPNHLASRAAGHTPRR